MISRLIPAIIQMELGMAGKVNLNMQAPGFSSAADG